MKINDTAHSYSVNIQMFSSPDVDLNDFKTVNDAIDGVKNWLKKNRWKKESITHITNSLKENVFYDTDDFGIFIYGVRKDGSYIVHIK